jgi:hypothetical protein
MQTVLDGTPAGSGDKEIPKVLDCGPYGNGVSIQLHTKMIRSSTQDLFHCKADYHVLTNPHLKHHRNMASLRC